MYNKEMLTKTAYDVTDGSMGSVNLPETSPSEKRCPSIQASIHTTAIMKINIIRAVWRCFYGGAKSGLKGRSVGSILHVIKCDNAKVALHRGVRV